MIFSKDGYVITNKHVVDDTEAKYSVVLYDGTIYNVDKIRFDDNLDIAVLKIVDDEGYMPADLIAAQIASMEDKVQIGQFALAIGNSLAEYQNSVTMGIISARNRELKINTSNLYI
ncbi:S1C family serine protease [Patescibacteria group bacterium]|nr:S1C family serine protease [Patescibacteria group bacterium]MBU1757651.1 S1C family serine protease [Patescibacteria group bacterium]